jgi:hypothetical protein
MRVGAAGVEGIVLEETQTFFCCRLNGPTPPPPLPSYHSTLDFSLCIENPIYVLPEKELRGLIPNSYIHASVRDLYIPRIGPHIWLQQNGQPDPLKI